MRTKHKFGLGDRVVITSKYTKLGWINPVEDDRAKINDESGRASIPKWIEEKLPKPRVGVVSGIRKITLRKWCDWVGEGKTAHWEVVGKELEAQAYIVAVDMGHTFKVAEGWMELAGERIKEGREG